MNTVKFLSLLSSPRTLIMGVLNITPDSFSDGGKFLDAQAAVTHAKDMFSEGADIIDIGGQSTRPPGNTYGSGAESINTDEELHRVIPVIKSLVSEIPSAIISIDTTKSEVAEKAIAAGATIINDVSGGTEDNRMFDVAKESNASIILMHGYGPEFSKNKIEEYSYNKVTDEVFEWLKKRIAAARAHGIQTILTDVGFGFAKNSDDNITLLRNHNKFTELDVQLVLGVSRKSTIGKILGGVPPSERVNGSIAAAIYGAMNGAKIIRTHDVGQTVEAMKVINALQKK